MSGRRLLIVRHHDPLRVIGEDEVLTAFSGDEIRLPRTDHVIDGRPLEESVEGGVWRPSDVFVRTAAAGLRNRIAEVGGEVHYFAMAEVPHVLALGAYVGDETLVHAHDYDRDRDNWAWPNDAPNLEIMIDGAPGETISQTGEVALLVEVSYPIRDADVDAVVGNESLGRIRVRPVAPPRPGIVRSTDDVLAVRTAVRDALSAVARHRPGASLIHLFIAAPVSVCFAVGQELRLRNGRDVQTYRYRAGDPEPYKRALLLTDRRASAAGRVLTDEERQLAREMWPAIRQALEDVQRHARDVRAEGEPWYGHLEPSAQIHEADPFRALTPLSLVVHDGHALSDDPRPADYAFRKDMPPTWEISEALVLGFFEAAGRDGERMRRLARLFFYHEYLHDWQVLTKYTAEDVGSFANCLEAVDYMADTYALIHQLDFGIRYEDVRDEKEQHRLLEDQIGLAIASFWAFEPPPPHFEWQERRLRRYLNWYWRWLQVRRAPDLITALRTLAQRPAIEIVGFKYRTGGGRHFVLLNEPRRGDKQEVGVVLEDGRFMRLGTSTDLSIEEVMLAFGMQNRDAIDRFFNSLMEHAKQSGSTHVID